MTIGGEDSDHHGFARYKDTHNNTGAEPAVLFAPIHQAVPIPIFRVWADHSVWVSEAFVVKAGGEQASPDIIPQGDDCNLGYGI